MTLLDPGSHVSLTVFSTPRKAFRTLSRIGMTDHHRPKVGCRSAKQQIGTTCIIYERRKGTGGPSSGSCIICTSTTVSGVGSASVLRITLLTSSSQQLRRRGGCRRTYALCVAILSAGVSVRFNIAERVQWTSAPHARIVGPRQEHQPSNRCWGEQGLHIWIFSKRMGV